VWKTCFIQVKHKDIGGTKHKGIGGTIQRSSLTQMSGDFSLLKYFKSFCEIKCNAATDCNLKQCGPFVDFEFVIYTNGKMKGKSPSQGSESPPQRGDSEPLSILSSGTDCEKYITFVEHTDTDIFSFFEELSRYHKLITELDSLLKGGTFVDKDIILKIDEFQCSVNSKEIKKKLTSLKSNLKKEYVTGLKEEVSKCDFTLFKKFLSDFKIFQNQSNEKSLQELIEKELQQACKASPSVANFIYTKFDEGFCKWWGKKGNVVWLNENSGQWQAVKKHIISEIREISKPEIQEINGCGVRFNEQHVQKLSDAIKQNTVLNIVTKSNIHILQKLKSCQSLNNFGYENSVFIGIKSLMYQRKEITKLWPCKWSDVLVVDCDSHGNVAHRVLDILQQSADCEQELDISDDNTIKLLVDVLQKYQQKLILISPRQYSSGFKRKLQNISYFEDDCDISNFDEKSQKQILGRPINFQGTNVALSALVGTDPPESVKALLDSEVISILLSNKHELSVGRQLGDHCKYYVPRVLQHQIYLKEDIFGLRDYIVTFAVSGLQVETLKKYLPASEKICRFVYNEREKNHSFNFFSDLSKIGLSAECGTMTTHKKLGQKMKSDDVRYNNFGNINTVIDFRERANIDSFINGVTFFKTFHSTDLENMQSYNEAGQNVKPEEVRYIILGNKNPDSEFRELKKLCRNLHWIHVEEGSFLWRDTNGNIDIIRRYIDNTKCGKYDEMKSVVEHKDRTMLLVAEPGMGKSTFLSYMAHEIKKWNPSVWVLRINLNEHTNELENIEFEQECIDKCKNFLWSAAHSPEQDALNVTKEIFLQDLEQTEKMVIILDGFDEISPDYSPKVEKIIRVIRDETAAKIWVSSRFPYRQELEAMLGKFAFTLQPFTPDNQISFLEQYWSKVTEISKEGNLKLFAQNILSLCSQNFSDNNGDFTGIPLQTMMLGEAFVNEAKKYCISGEFNLPKKFNLLSLFQMFWKKKCYIYFSEKNSMDSSKLEVKREKESYLQTHMNLALIHLFSQHDLNKFLGAMNGRDMQQAKNFLQSGRVEQFGIIREITDGKLQFIHQSFAEYFAAKWFTVNFRMCQDFISNILFNTTYQITRNIFDRMLAEDSEIHCAILNNDIEALEELLKQETNINSSDKGGRTALHLAASYNRPFTKTLLSFQGVDAKKQDAVLKWTPLRYADRNKSWMSMDNLLQNGGNPDDIVFTRHNAKTQEWGQAALWECASQGHRKLLEFMLNCGNQVNAIVDVPENLHDKYTLLHRASYCGQEEVVRFIANRGADINIRDVTNNTALHHAAHSGSVDIIKLLLDKGMSVNLTNIHEYTPLHVSAHFGHLEATKALVERVAAINSTDKYGVTPLIEAAYSGKLETFRFLTEIGADINIRDVTNNTALHLAAQSGSVDIINLLLDKGMSVNLTDKNDNTPLHVSAQFGHLEATKALVEGGAAINYTNNYGATPLLEAAYGGKLDTFCYLTEIGADINIRDVTNNTALHLAAQSGSVDIIKLLLDKGMSVNLTDKNDYTPLHVSAQFGHLEATKALVKRGAAINYTNNYGATPLLEAAYGGKLDTFRYLTEIGANINIRDVTNNTALHLAAQSGSVDIIKLLLDKGMSVNLTDKNDYTPLHVSAHFGHLEATKALVERGAAINNTNKYGATPIMVAAQHGKLEIFRYLTEIGADINILDAKNNTTLHYVALSGNVDIIKLLLDKGMSVNLTDTKDSTPQHVSVQFGHLEATKALVERGAALNNTNKYGATPLIVAAYSGKLEIFRYLTEIGADINIRDVTNNTALHHAAKSGSVDIIKLLLDKGMSVNLTEADEFTPLHTSVESGNLDATKILVERGAAINYTDGDGFTPLTVAACCGQLEIFRYLTEIGADINIHDHDGSSALHLAAEWGSVDIINVLLGNGVSVNLTDTDGSTPLHVSAEFGHLEAMKILVNRGAALNITNKAGNTPLMLAAYCGELETFRYLSEIGALIDIRNAKNNTALHLAAESGGVDIIKLLLDKGMSVNLTNTGEFTPLHISAAFGHQESTKILVEGGAAVNSTNKYGITPLMLAAYNGKLEVFRYLKEIGAGINIRNANNINVLHLAISLRDA